MISLCFSLSTAALRLAISSATFADIYSSLFQRAISNPPHRFLSNISKTDRMFTYDGIRSQLEWNSTLSVSNAPQPTADTKFLRKVSCTPNFMSAFISSDLDPADCNHRHHRCVIFLLVELIILIAHPRSKYEHRREACCVETCWCQCRSVAMSYLYNIDSTQPPFKFA